MRVLDCPLDDHDAVVQRSLDLLDELVGAATENERARLGFGAALENVEALSANLALVKCAAPAKMLVRNVGTRRLNRAADRLNNALQILGRDSAGAEDVTVGKVLGREVANRQLRQNNLGTRRDDRLELLVNDAPLGVDDGLVLLLTLGDQDEGGRSAFESAVESRVRRVRTETSLTRTSALSFSALSSSSTLRQSTLGSLNDLGCCSKPAYENVFLKATPRTSSESCMPPPGTFLMPIKFSSRSS